MIATELEIIYKPEMEKKKAEAGKLHGRGQPATGKVTANLQQPIREPTAVDLAAKDMKVLPRTVYDAKAIKKANPKLAEQVKSGEVTLAQARNQVKRRISTRLLDACGAARRDASQPVGKSSRWGLAKFRGYFLYGGCAQGKPGVAIRDRRRTGWCVSVDMSTVPRLWKF